MIRYRSCRLLWALAPIIGAQMGCQGDDDSAQVSIYTGGAGGNSPASSAGNTAVGGNSSNAGASNAVGGKTAATVTNNYGQVILTSLRQYGPASAEAYPLFRPSVPSCPPDQTFGDCSYTSAASCNFLTPTVVSAGAVTIASTTTIPPVNVIISPNSDGSYTQTSLGTSLLGSEQIHLNALGGTVPAFSADITVPLVLLVNSPSYDASGVITASVKNDLVIQFSRGAAGVTMEVLATTAAGTLDCSVDSQKGQLTIPAGALAAFGAGNQFSLLTSGIAEIPAGNSWSVAVGAVMNAMTPDRTQTITVKLQ